MGDRFVAVLDAVATPRIADLIQHPMVATLLWKRAFTHPVWLDASLPVPPVS